MRVVNEQLLHGGIGSSIHQVHPHNPNVHVHFPASEEAKVRDTSDDEEEEEERRANDNDREDFDDEEGGVHGEEEPEDDLNKRD